MGTGGSKPSQAKPTVTKKSSRKRDYEGYSTKRKDQVELILSTLNSQLKQTKRSYKDAVGTLVLP